MGRKKCVTYELYKHITYSRKRETIEFFPFLQDSNLLKYSRILMIV